jgi:acyl-CoA synthetase (NDP forming)
MAEVTMTLLRLKPSPGKRVAVLTAGGGSSVAAGDICAQEGIELPALSEQTKAGLLDFITLVNQGVANPIDVPGVIVDYPSLKRTYELLAADPMIDMVILHLGVGAGFISMALNMIAELKRHISSSAEQNPRLKPFVVALSNEGQAHDTEKYEQQFKEIGVPAYSSLRTACRALNRFANYYKFLDDVGITP